MKKRILTVLCALALLIGAFGIAAAAIAPVAVIGNDSFNSLQDAVDAIEEGATGLIELKKATSETVNVSCDVYVDLAGNNIAGVNVTAGTFYGMDSATIIEAGDTAAVSYGKIAAVDGAVKAISVDDGYSVDSYLLSGETTNVSFHAVNLRLSDMTLRAEDAGVYFKSAFAGDEKVAAQVKSFGVALSAEETPNAENIKANRAVSKFTGFEAGVNDNATSTLLKGIMKTENGYIINKRNANAPVYGRAYVELKDGTFIFGEAKSRSLKEQVQLLTTANDDVVEMYKTFKSVMKEWDNITAVNTAYQAAEDDVLKILMIGNSHGQDSTWLLNEVFKKEYPNQQVVIGDLYHDGTAMEWHTYYARYDRPFYTYWKNGDFEGSREDGAWTEPCNSDATTSVYNTSIRYALQDEPWDFVIIQEMNTRVGVDNAEDSYHGWNANYYKFLCEYVLDNVDRVNGKAPALGFNMMWANPDDEIYFIDGNKGGLGLRGTEDDGTVKAENWGKNLARLYHYESDPNTFVNRLHYNAMVSNVQNHLVNNQEEFLGKKYIDFVLTPGTAIQYALDVQLLAQNEIYRDYTHMNDYGRTMAAYVLCAQLMAQYNDLTAPQLYSEIKLDGIKATAKATAGESLHVQRDTPNPEYDEATDSYLFVGNDKRNILEAVNWALEHPFTVE